MAKKRTPMNKIKEVLRLKYDCGRGHKNSPDKQERFVPNIENFKTSLGYEGLKMKESSEKQSIASLKRKYAR